MGALSYDHGYCNHALIEVTEASSLVYLHSNTSHQSYIVGVRSACVCVVCRPCSAILCYLFLLLTKSEKLTLLAFWLERFATKTIWTTKWKLYMYIVKIEIK